MKPLLFIFAVTALGIIVALQFGETVTWFNYYAGAVGGLLTGGAALGYWSKRKRAREEEAARNKKQRGAWKRGS